MRSDVYEDLAAFIVNHYFEREYFDLDVVSDGGVGKIGESLRFGWISPLCAQLIFISQKTLFGEIASPAIALGRQADGGTVPAYEVRNNLKLIEAVESTRYSRKIILLACRR